MVNLDAETQERTAANYERLLVPALFEPWAQVAADSVQIAEGSRLLDVACGTGVLARKFADRSSDQMVIVGLDANPGMLAVARRSAPKIDWRDGDALAIPFADDSFDIVASQFALMLFEDRLQALREMWRVLKPGGYLTVLVFDGLGSNKDYQTISEVYEKRAGQAVADALRFPFSLGDVEQLRDLFGDAGIAPIELTTKSIIARYKSTSDLVHSDVDGWFPFAGIELSEKTISEVVADVSRLFVNSIQHGGRVELETFAHVVTAVKN